MRGENELSLSPDTFILLFQFILVNERGRPRKDLCKVACPHYFRIIAGENPTQEAVEFARKLRRV